MDLSSKLYESIERKDAIACINKEMGLAITGEEFTLSNINNAEDVWWNDIDNKKFKADLYIAHFDNRNKKLNVFFLPANTIQDPKSIFSQRDNGDTTSIEIRIDDKDFTDKKGKNRFSFKPYLVKQIQL